MAQKTRPLVGLILGSQSDWETMQHATAQLDELKVPYEAFRQKQTERGLANRIPKP